jgi:hypothetical protein
VQQPVVSMLERLKAAFRSEDFIPTAAIFPDIEAEKIAKDLKLEEQGRTRGVANQPASEAKDHDHIETGIVARTEELRRRGLENYETNRRVYNERLARAGNATKEVDIVAGMARGDFGTLVQSWQSAIEGARERLADAFRWRARFREVNRVEHPAQAFEGWVRFVALTVVLIVLEAGMNAYLFSQGNEFGLLGGLLAAVIVSVVNVGWSTLSGFSARSINRRNLLIRLFGLIVILSWLAFAVTLNLVVAHFRDGLESGVTWRQSAEAAIPAFLANPIVLASVESWLLAAIGMLISVLAFLKGWHADDPYPGYGRVERMVGSARQVYVTELTEALADLSDKRDKAIGELQDASEQVRQGIAEAVDALFGQSALSAHLQAFMDQCDVKTAHLLAIYRDANRAARTSPSPKSFEKPYKFPPFSPPPVESSRRDQAEKEAEKVSQTVEAAIADIFAQFEAARTAFDVARVVQASDTKAAP